jgi:hypothetical protein
MQRMESDDFKPPMFQLESPLPDMTSGKIKISHARGEAIGHLIPYYRPKEQLFGARIDILGPIIYDSGTVIILKLCRKLLRNIQRTQSADIPYALKIDEDLSALLRSSAPQ